MENLDLAYAGGDEAQRSFAEALKLIETGEMEAAETKLRALQDQSADPLTRKHSTKLLSSLLFYQSKWTDHQKLAQGPMAEEVDDKALTEAYSKAPGETYAFPPKPVELSIALSRTGSPIVPVTVNGQRRNFWLDTGAGVSVLSSDVAPECKVRPANERQERTQTATSKEISSQPAIIDEMEIGGIRIRNHPAIILQKKDLEIKLFGFIPFVKIDGIIGWNAIQHMDITVDYANKRAVFRQPIRDAGLQRNFFWIGYPAVTVQAGNGRKLRFGLDTGASSSSIRENIFKKITAAGVKSENIRTGSAGGWDDSKAKVIPSLDLLLSGYRLKMQEIATRPSDLATFIKLDGILGSDIAQGGRIRIDALNGRFTLDAGADNATR